MSLVLGDEEHKALRPLVSLWCVCDLFGADVSPGTACLSVITPESVGLLFVGRTNGTSPGLSCRRLGDLGSELACFGLATGGSNPIIWAAAF